MNLEETETILRRIAAFDQTKPLTDERTEAWTEMLADIDYVDAERAVRSHFANSGEELTLALLRKQAKLYRSLRVEQEDAASGRLRAGCGRAKCVCTHTGCDAGWIDVEDYTQRGIVYDQVRPCPVCRGDVAAVAEAAKNRGHFQSMIRDLERRELETSKTAWND